METRFLLLTLKCKKILWIHSSIKNLRVCHQQSRIVQNICKIKCWQEWSDAETQQGKKTHKQLRGQLRDNMGVCQADFGNNSKVRDYRTWGKVTNWIPLRIADDNTGTEVRKALWWQDSDRKASKMCV